MWGWSFIMKSHQGFTLVETAIAVAIIGLVAAIAIPSFRVARNSSLNKIKQSNIRLLNDAIQTWAMETLRSDDAPIKAAVTNYIKGGLEALRVGDITVNLTNITSKTVGHTFTVDDLY